MPRPSARTPHPRRCPGFDASEGKCPNPPGSPWDDRLCWACTTRRLDVLSIRLAVSVGVAAGAETTEEEEE